jgi:hypothetical protein
VTGKTAFDTQTGKEDILREFRAGLAFQSDPEGRPTFRRIDFTPASRDEIRFDKTPDLPWTVFAKRTRDGASWLAR